MDNAIEAAAKAIAEDEFPGHFDKAADWWKDKFRRRAKAALDAAQLSKPLSNAEPVTSGNRLPFREVVTILESLYSPEEIEQWFNAPQPLLNNETPIRLIATGRLDDLHGVLRRLDEGVYI